MLTFMTTMQVHNDILDAIPKPHHIVMLSRHVVTFNRHVVWFNRHVVMSGCHDAKMRHI